MSAQAATSADTEGAGRLAPPIGFADRYLFLPIICVYAFLIQFGSLTRFGDEGTSRGLTTLIVFLLLAMGAMKIANAALNERTFWWLLAIVFYQFLPSVLSDAAVASAFKNSQLLAYVLLAAVTARTRFDTLGLSRIWLLLAAGMGLSAGLTVIDFVGIVDIPRNNEAVIATHLGEEPIDQATGFFVRRSGMAAIFCMGISGATLLALCPIPLWRRVFFASCAFVAVVCLFLTHNRSGILGSVAAVSLIVLFSARFSGVKKIGSIAAAALLGAVFLAIVATYFPDVLKVYATQLGFLGFSDTSASASDVARVEMFWIAIRSIATDPLGHGFTLIPWRWKFLDAHNIFTTVIWGTGIVGLIWLPAFGVFMAARLRPLGQLAGSPYHTALGCALIAWLMNGLVHNIMFASLAWMFLGILLSHLHFGNEDTPGSGNAPGTSVPDTVQTPWLPRGASASEP